ncbi:MAG: Asp-tRNA(Asn)/Glu-tRNA(Gln) amidotransferase subunit GatB [Chitinophagaceae bacterium]|nr:MAG: Asp-tRNA(Asn)/Glu-tRNA(Gln) amidotransferase subunit GatB [Chitinophagaceae bacterium]
MTVNNKYEAVIGLEVHAQLQTKSKAFSKDPVSYGEKPNTMVDPVSLGHPGTLPVFNKEVVAMALKMGLACEADIREVNQFARKNYFYADLPKGYQITQDDTPICTNGFVEYKMGDETKKVRLIRIHMEEDAGKSIHDLDPFNTLIDLNRCGVPLIEIVTMPDLRSGDEAFAYLMEMRKLVRYLDVCDGNMEEGSLRCDANISVRLRGAEEYGQKVEVKNMNSMRNVKKAIEFEIERQIDCLETGIEIMHETRSFDASKGTTFSMRSKEEANDYRYFPEPDLPPVIVDEAWLNEVKASMPALPKELTKIFTKELGLSEYDATVITEDKQIALYFQNLTKLTKNYKAAANWIIGPVKSYLNEKALHFEDFPLPEQKIAEIIDLIDEGKLSFTAASQKLFPVMAQSPEKPAKELAESLNLIQDSDEDTLSGFVLEAIQAYPEKVKEYQAGKKGLMGLFMGEVMKRSKGKADPKKASAILQEMLDKA